jgi:hypothetical protein
MSGSGPSSTALMATPSSKAVLGALARLSGGGADVTGIV